MKVTLKVDSKELSMIITGLRKVISDNEYILKSTSLGIDAIALAEQNIYKTEKLIERIQRAYAAQTLQYKPEEDGK